MAKWIAGIILFIVIIIVVAGCLYLNSTVPEYDGSLSVSGIQAPVEIIRDLSGVPHIYAEADEDVYFSLGYAMAQDRLFQMEMIRLVSQGRLSEIMGKATLKVDKLYRTVFSTLDVKRIQEAMDPKVRRTVEAFTRGINFYLEHREEPLSFEFLLLRHEPEQWKPEDIMSIYFFYCWMFSHSMKNELLHAAAIDQVGDIMAQDLFQDYNDGYPATISDRRSYSDMRIRYSHLKNVREVASIAKEILPVLSRADDVLTSIGFSKTHMACNSVVISGKISRTGKPILFQDCHNPFSIPPLWYEAHLVTPKMNASGYVIVCTPYIFAGQNEHLAWVFTAGLSDDADFYLEKMHPKDNRKYYFKGRWEKVAVKREVIKVKGVDDITMEIRVTRHGPIIDDVVSDYTRIPPSKALSMRWGLTDLYKGLEAPYHFERAKGADDFIAAVKRYKYPAINWIYADDSGAIGYFYGAGIPIRKGFDGKLPVPGWKGEFEWQGYVPSDKQPQVRNPFSGFINTSNAMPARVYPFRIGNFVPPDRLTRVREIIESIVNEKGYFTVEDAHRIFSDCFVLMARELVPLMIQSLEGETLSVNEKKVLEKLTVWDFVSDKEGIAPAVFQVLLVRMVENTFSVRLGKTLYSEYIKSKSMPVKGLRKVMLDENSPWFDDPGTPTKESRSNILNKSFKEAIAYLDREMGSDVEDWKLGDLMPLTLKHPFSGKVPFLSLLTDIGPYPMDGGLITPYNSSYRIENPFFIVGGSTNRFVVDFADRHNSKIIAMPGISGNFMSPHYDDQMYKWYNFKFRPFMLYRDQVEKDKEYTTKLIPQ